MHILVRHSLRLFLLGLFGLAVPVASAGTPAATVTTIAASASTVAAGASTQLTVTVKSGGVAVTTGQVAICGYAAYACSASEAFAVLQLSAGGTATIPVYGIGSQYYQAAYAGTAAFATSNSGSSYAVVTFTNTSVPTTTAITNIAGSAGAYTLTGTVTATSLATASPQFASAAISFYDTSNGSHLLGTASSSGQPSSFTFVPGTMPAAGTQPAYVASGDFNKDGHSDLAVVNTSDGTVSILLGNGDGTFRTKVNYAVGTAPGPIAVGDFNADGSLDLAVVNNTSKTISILVGNGDGTFAGQVTYPTGNNPLALAVGDINQDGYSDLVVLNHDDKTIGVLMNSGTGTFAAQVTYATGNDPRSISIGNSELSGVPPDGIPDVAIANFADNTITILDGKGDGTLLAATAQTTVNTGNGPIFVSLADVSDSGYAGLSYLDYTDNVMSIMSATFQGALTTTTYSTGTGPVALMFGFFTTEAAPVPAVLNSDGSLSVYISDGNYDGVEGATPNTYTTTQAGAVSLVSGDFNGDGQPDLLIGGTSSVSPLVELQEALYQTTYVLSNVSVPGTSTSNVIATYPGETNFLGSTSAPVSLTDSPIVTATTLAISPSASYDTPGQVVTMTAAMTPTALGNYVPTGSFEFFDGTTVVCASVPMASFTASCSTSALPISHNVFTAKYLGDTYFASSTSLTKVVNVANTTAVGLSLSATSVVLGTAVTATATVTQSSNSAPVEGGVVNFCSTTACAGAALLGTATLQSAHGAAPGTAKISLHLTTGAHTIYAEFVGTSQEAPMISGSQPVTVTAPAKTESITTLTSSGSAGSYTLTASVAGADPSAVPSGTVSFTDTKNTLFTVQSKTLSGSTAGYTFDTATSIPYSGDGVVNAMVVADVNGDGINDLLYTNSSDETLEIQLGTGGGAFGPVTEYTLSSNVYCDPEGITVADVNGDGYPDIIVADDGYDFANSAAIGKVYVFFGKSNGTFSATPDEVLDIGDENVNDLPYSYPGPSSTVVADFNQDGIPDLAVGTDEGTVYTLLGNGDGTFQSPVLYPAVTSTYSQDVIGLTAIDINGDGFLDIGYAELAGFSAVMLGNGDGTFQPAILSQNNGAGEFVGGAIFKDFNGDGYPDLVMTSAANSLVCVQLGNGDGTFQNGNGNSSGNCITVANNGGPEAIVTADFTGDGKLDLATAIYSSGVAIFPGNGDGTFGAQKNFSGGSDNVQLVTGDLNGDGLPDLVADDYNSESLKLFTNRLTLTSTGRFTGVSIPGSATTSQHSLVATYAGDSSHTGSSSSGLKIAGTPIPTTTTLAINPSSSQAYGVAETLKATVTPTITSSFPMAGTVTFKDSGTSLTPNGNFGTGSTSNNSTYTPSGGSFLPLYGSHSFTAVYNVDTVKNFVTSTSSALAFTVTKGTPVITWSPPGGISSGNTLALVTTATTPVPGTFTYTATPSGGSATTVTSSTVLALGTYTITASFAPTTPADYNTPAPVSATLVVLLDHVWLMGVDGSLDEFGDNGTQVGSGPVIAGGAGSATAGGIAFDHTGNLWSVNSATNQLQSATYTGGSATVDTGGGLNAPVAVAVDGVGNVWVANSGGNTVSVFNNAGVVVGPSTGYAMAGSLNAPSAVSIDSAGGVWIANQGGTTLTYVVGAAAPVVAPVSTAVTNGTLGTAP